MKKLLLFLLVLITINIQTLSAQELDITETTIIKDLDGKTISLDKFAQLMNSGDYTLKQKTDTNGTAYIQLIKATAAQKELFKKMIEQQLNPTDLKDTKAPSFSFTDMNGTAITSENTKGKVVVINFWFIACKPCVAEIPDLNKVYDTYKDNKNVVFASVTFDQKDNVETFLKTHPFKYPVITNDSATIDRFGISGYPTNIVIGKDGKYMSSITGGFPQVGDQIKDTIAKALKAK